MSHLNKFKYFVFFLSLIFYTIIANAADTVGIGEVDDMIQKGQSMIRYAAKWGGILTVVSAALALGSGRLQGALAHTICKILIVIGLLVAAFTFFGAKISWGFSF